MKYLETDLKFYKRVAAVAIPISAQSLITMGVNMLDTIMLGQLGETSLSAASLSNQFIMLFQICCMGIGMGASVLTSRFWGQKDLTSLKKVIALALRFTVIFAAAFTLLNVLFPSFIISIYSPDAAIIQNGSIYLKWSSATFFLGGISLVCSNIMRSVGLARVPLYAAIAALFVNLGGNYAFIFGKLGAPEMGIAGAALGTTFARIVELSIILVAFFLHDKRVGFKIRDLFAKCKDILPEYIKISIPVLISDALLALGTNAVAMVMGRIGADFVAANSITAITQQISMVFIQGMSFAASIITGHTLGEGRISDAKRQGYTFFWIGILIGCIGGIMIYLIRTPVINAYNITTHTKALTEQLMDAISVIVVFQAANNILTKGVLRGGGDTKFLMIADILFLWILSIPLGVAAGLWLHLPAFWIYFCLKIDQFVKAIWCVFRLHSGKWIKKIKNFEGEENIE